MRPPRGRTRARSATTTRATWTRRPSRRRASRRCSRRSTRSRRSATAGRSPATSAARCARDVDALNNTNFYTDNLFGVWVAAGPRRADALRARSCCRAGSTCRTARTTWTRRRGWTSSARSAARTSRPCSARRGWRMPTRARRACSSSRRRSPTRTRSREDSEDVEEGEQPLVARGLRREGAGRRLERALPAAGLAGQRGDRRVAAGRVTGARGAARRASRSTTWKDYLAFHAIDHFANVLPEAFGEERFAFHGTALSGTPQRRERWKRAVDVGQRGAGRGGRPALRRAVLPAGGQGARAGDGREPAGRVRPPHRRARPG